MPEQDDAKFYPQKQEYDIHPKQKLSGKEWTRRKAARKQQKRSRRINSK